MANRFAAGCTILLTAFLSFACAEAQPAIEWNYTAGGIVNSVAAAEQGDCIAAGSENNYLYVFNRSGYLLWNSTTEAPVLGVAVSASCEFVAAVDNFKVYLFNGSGSPLWQKYMGNIRSIAISESGDYIVASSSEYVVLLDKKGEEVWRQSMDASAFSVAVSAQGEVAAGTSGGTIHLLNKSGILWNYNTSRYITSVDMHNRRVIAGSRYLYSIENGKEVWTYIPREEISGVDISPSGNNITAISVKGTIYFLDKSGKLHWSYSLNKTAKDVATSEKGDYIIAAADTEIYFISRKVVAALVNITSPKNLETVSGIAIINASVISFDRVAVYIDGNYACASLPCNWDTSASPEGKHTITVKVTDAKGNVGESSVEVVVERKPAPLPLPTIINESKIEEKISNVTAAINEKRLDFSFIKSYLLIGAIFIGVVLILKIRKREKKYRWKRR